MSTYFCFQFLAQTISFRNRWRYDDLTFLDLSSSIEMNDVKIELYPNPASEILNIEISEMPINGKLTITIISSDGKIMSELILSQLISNMDISSYPSGLYTAKITDGKQTIFVDKFVKIK